MDSGRMRERWLRFMRTCRREKSLTEVGGVVESMLNIIAVEDE